MTNTQACLMLAVLITASAAVIVVLARHERGAAGLHSHADGTTHRHLGGALHHVHPTRWERWTALLERHWGPPPDGWHPDVEDLATPPCRRR